MESDHGDMQGCHGLLNKCLPYEESCGIPLVISSPGGQKGILIDTPVSSIDYFPTCLEYAGRPQIQSKPGRSLAPLVSGAKTEEEYDEPVFAEILMGPIDKQWVMIRTKNYKMAIKVKDKKPYLLFDMENDKYEMNNLIEKEEYITTVELLVKKFYEWENK